MMRNQRLYSRDYLTAAKVNKKYLKLERYLSYSIFILSVWLAHTK
jgi:hypothetical protein